MSSTKTSNQKQGLSSILKSAVLRNKRAQSYCALIPLCSLLSLPDAYKIDKHNPLNQWFVKLGWFWTLIAILPLQFAPIKSQDKEAVFKSILRTLVSSALWYVSVNLFEIIDSHTGFDISGHTFLLTFSTMLLSSELKSITAHANESGKQQIQLHSTLGMQNYLTIKTSAFALMFLWDFMLLQTAFYYHTLIQKFIALLWAIGAWCLLDVLFYQKPRTAVNTLGFGDR